MLKECVTLGIGKSTKQQVFLKHVFFKKPGCEKP